MLLRLGTDAYLSSNAPGDALPGRNPTTHRAQVLIDGQAQPSIVKIPHPKDVRFALFRESLCFLLAKELKLLPPKTWAAVLDVPVPLLPPMARKHSGWLHRYEEATAWCQPWFPCPDLRHTDGPALLSLMSRSKLGVKILAFDEWIANGDRHGENLLRCEDGVLIPIDHEEALGGLSARLFGSPCDSNGPLLQYGPVLEPPQYRQITNQALLEHAHYHKALDTVESTLPSWLLELPDCHSQIGDAFQFLRHRAGQDWFKNRVGLLI